MVDPTPASQILGCNYDLSEIVDAKGNRVKTMTQNMESFLKQCLEAYEQCVADCGGGGARSNTKKCQHPSLKKTTNSMLPVPLHLVPVVPFVLGAKSSCQRTNLSC